MGDEADHRRAEQKPEKSDRRDGRQRHPRQHRFRPPGQAVTQRHDRRRSESDQQKSQRGGSQVREQHRQQQPGRDDDAAGADHPDRPEPRYEPVGGEPAAGHRAHEGDVAEPDQLFRRSDDRFEIDAAPVEHGSLAGHAAESDQSEQQDVTVGTDENLFRFFFVGRLGVARQHRAAHRDEHRECNRINDAEMHQRRNVVTNHQRADQPSAESGQRPQAVERRHDTAVVEPFDADSLRVDGDVAQVGRDAEQEESQRELSNRRGRSESDQRGRVEQRCYGQYQLAAVAADQVARQRHCGELSDR